MRRKTSFRWKTKSGKLTPKAKKYLSTTLKEKYRWKKRIARAKKRRPELFARIKYTISFKAKYDSPRGPGHDFFSEGTLTIITAKPLSDEHIRNIIYERLTSGRFDTQTGFKDFFDSIQYTSIEIGTSKESTTEDEQETMEVTKYGYRIET
jgi:hypothetical protein